MCTTLHMQLFAVQYLPSSVCNAHCACVQCAMCTYAQLCPQHRAPLPARPICLIAPQWDEHHSVCTHSLTNFKWISKLHSKIQGNVWKWPKNVNVNIFCGQKANTFAQILTLSGLCRMCRIPSSHFTGIACKACIASSVVTTIEQGMTTRNLTANARLKHTSGSHSAAFFSATAQMEKLAKSWKNAKYWIHNTLSIQ